MAPRTSSGSARTCCSSPSTAPPRPSTPTSSATPTSAGPGAGEGFTHNFPLPRSTTWSEYSATLDAALDVVARFTPDALVVSLGVDTFEGDPISPIALAREHFPLMGQRLAALRLPTVLVQEGGYAVEDIGTNVVGVLAGFAAER